MRALSIIINIVIIFVGSVVTLIAYPAKGLFMSYSTDLGLAVFTFITIILITILLASEVFSMLRISDSSYHTVLMALFVLLYAAFSPDSLSFWAMVGVNYSILWLSESITEVAFIGGVIATFHMLSYTYRPKGKRTSIIPLLVAGIISAVLYGIFTIWELQYIGHFLFSAFALIYFLIYQVRCFKAKADCFIFYATTAVFCSFIGMHSTSILYYCGKVTNVMWWSSGYIWLILTCFIAVYIAFILKTEKTAIKAEEFRHQAEELKTNMLVEQFKPHFVSNALMIIKTTYHLDPQEGDRAIWLFSNYMRDTVGMLKAGMVPLEKELEFVMHYIDFCNVGAKREFKLVFDIDFADFSVPALSLQPYIENAVKYSKVNQIEDGCITISSYADKENIYLKIADNGVGFASKEQKEGSTGISNSEERFSILLNAKTTIELESEGTVISITIPRIEEGDADENHDS